MNQPEDPPELTPEVDPDEVVLLCDAMLGGLARWLRAAGYRSEFARGAEDGALVRRAYHEGKVLLTSDSGIMERYAITEGVVACLFVPREMSLTEQLGYVLGRLGLAVRASRCMECGGRLREVPLGVVKEEVPRKVRSRCDKFYRCEECEKVYWHGTHWRDIARRLERAAELARGHGPEG